MNFLGSKTIETDRLILKSQTMEEQKRLWEILMIPEVNKYFLAVPPKFREKLKDWNIQKKYYEEQMEKSKDKDVFKWSIFLKDSNICIGMVSCQKSYDENNNLNNPDVRDVGWFIDPEYHSKGYCTEAAKAMIDFMFKECEIKEIITGAAICNPSSWRIMEKLGFERQSKTKMIEYTFLDENIEIYVYKITKEQYLSKNKMLLKKER